MNDAMIYLNGQMVEAASVHLSALDRGFTLGDGVFDTMRAAHGEVFRLRDHLERLQWAAETLDIPMPVSRAELGEAVRSLLVTNGLTDAVVRVTITRGIQAERGLVPPRSPSPTVAIHAVPFEPLAEERYQKGFAAAVAGIRRNESSPLSYIKSCSYLDSVLARMQAASRGADEALLLNCVGSLACGASSNVFLVLEGKLVTPSLDSGVLNGVTRRTVLEQAAKLGLECSERTVSPQELYSAEEAFLTNTAIGVMPLTAVDLRPISWGTPGPITLKLRAAYLELLPAE